ncbi:MAG: [Clostridia bacterium]|nr:[FeFe] hydrogenase H-cluster radical SAM maturase HydE [Clostridia bacterium]
MICENDVKILREKQDLPDDKLKSLLSTDEFDLVLAKNADEVRRENYGSDVYIRGLIEFTNHCKNNCLYCGVRRGNSDAQRYRLGKSDILACCDEGYALGFRTFVLQGGEDPHYTDEVLCEIVSSIKKKYPDCAVTLSAGERSKESYKKLFEAGADRYLLRHETANVEHYGKLHPAEMSLENRKKCLFELKKIGYQVGSGFMVGSPYQTNDNIVEDLRFLQKLQPDMIGIGPFIRHSKTPLGEFENGSVEMTLRLISILRLMFPKALIPATTALGTLKNDGRELGLKSGANVVMPNLSPVENRRKYEIYENKICLGDEAAQCIECLKSRVKSVGYNIVVDVGNAKTKE